MGSCELRLIVGENPTRTLFGGETFIRTGKNSGHNFVGRPIHTRLTARNTWLCEFESHPVHFEKTRAGLMGSACAAGKEYVLPTTSSSAIYESAIRLTKRSTSTNLSQGSWNFPVLRLPSNRRPTA